MKRTDAEKKCNALAEKLQSMQPWNQYQDNDLIVLHFNDAEDVFVTIMGNAGKIFGISFYPGEQGLDALLRILHSDAEDINSHRYYGFDVDNLTLYYDDVKTIKEGPFLDCLDSEYKNRKGRVPYFVLFEQGFVPGRPDEKFFEQMQRYLSGLIRTLEECDSTGLTYKSDEEVLYSMMMDEDPDDISVTVLPYPTMSLRFADLPYDEKDAAAHFRNMKRTDETVIIDMDYLDAMESEDLDKQFFPLLIIAVAENGQIRKGSFLMPRENRIASIRNFLYEYVKENGIPKNIYARRDEILHILEPICNDQKIELYELMDSGIDDVYTQIRKMANEDLSNPMS